MSEQGEAQEQRGSVKISRNAKGEAQWEVKAYLGDAVLDLGLARDNALRIYRELETEFSGRAA